MTVIDWVEQGRVPDSLIRLGIRRRCAGLLTRESTGGEEAIEIRKQLLATEVAAGPLAIHTDDANSQHYEVPAAFFEQVLGRFLKYSCGYWPAGVSDLDTSEQAMLELSARRALISDGQKILDLGCGWGSMSLYLAESFPNASVTGVSNSASQRNFIMDCARQRGLSNLDIITADINDFRPQSQFDRIVSIEMLEHVRNYRLLFARMASWLEAEGLAFVHVFCHRQIAYSFETEDPDDWMARHFFTGGMMPSVDFFDLFDDHLVANERWLVPGIHYQRTADAWLEKMDQRVDAITSILRQAYGPTSEVQRMRWRMFFMACAELFGFRQGREWMVAHYRFEKARRI